MTEDINLHIGKRLRQRRRMLGLTQQKLAAGIDVRFQQIQKYEAGQNAISAARLWQLASALEVSVNYFYEGLPRTTKPVAVNHKPPQSWSKPTD